MNAQEFKRRFKKLTLKEILPSSSSKHTDLMDDLHDQFEAIDFSIPNHTTNLMIQLLKDSCLDNNNQREAVELIEDYHEYIKNPSQDYYPKRRGQSSFSQMELACSCGAKHTSRPSFHLFYCDIK